MNRAPSAGRPSVAHVGGLRSVDKEHCGRVLEVRSGAGDTIDRVALWDDGRARDARKHFALLADVARWGRGGEDCHAGAAPRASAADAIP